MPYKIQRKGKHYQVINAETGEVKATSTSKAKAEKQLRLLRGIERGWQPSGRDTYTRKINGKQVSLRVTGGNKSGS